MDGFSEIQKRLLNRHSKAIVHMRKRLADGKFSLVFGAGISRDFGIPEWDQLVKNIAKDRKVIGSRLLERNKDRPLTSKTQLLFHHFAAKLNAKSKRKDLSIGEVRNEWRNIVRKYLYKDGKRVEDIKRKHPYLSRFMDIVEKTPMTINYNFDDYIEQILQTETGDTRNYETVWNPQLQTKLNKCVLYHPNGFLPKHKMERQSEGLVFCEDEFADQLIETMAGRYASLLHHYSQNTCLFLGLSLKDSTLKHLLRQSAKLNPGHYHYYVAHQTKRAKLVKKHQEAVYEANFNLYNLITLFLTNEEIKELGNLLSLREAAFVANARTDKIKLVYCYYVVGAVGAGKSTVISYFRNLFTHDEWPDFRIPELAKDWKKLSKRQKTKVNNWIAGQFKKKNRTLSIALYGLHIIDRAPLDPIAFTDTNERPQKASFLLEKICTGDDGHNIRKGHVILLSGKPDVLEERAKSSGKEYRARKLCEMQDTLRRIYKSPRLSVVDTDNKSPDKVVKEIGRIVHKQDYYEEIGLHRRIQNIKGGRYQC